MGEIAAARFSDPGSIPGASIGLQMKRAHVYGVFRRHELLIFKFGVNPLSILIKDITAMDKAKARELTL